MQKPQSQELFYDLYGKISKNLEESEGTIFNGVSINKDTFKNYTLFMESAYANMFFAEETVYEKNKVITAFIENTVLSEMYTNIYDRLLNESDDNELSFSQELLLETTQQQVNVKYLGDNPQVLEEISGLGVGIPAAIGFFTGSWIPAVAFSAIAMFGMELLLPSRWAKASNDFAEKGFGLLGKALVNSKSILAMGNTTFAASNNNILNFDNIDTNPEVKKLFGQLARSNNKKAGINGISTIVASCVENNGILEDADMEDSQKGFFRGLYSPRNNNVFTVMIESIFKKTSTKSGKTYGTLLSYRKCLIEKLMDMYKFLMIANLSQSRDYKKILRVMHKGFNNNPEQLLSFMHTEDEANIINKDNIITLVKFRMFLADMVKELRKGAFDVDREASIFLDQKLNQIDLEIEDYLARNKKQIENMNTSYENQNDFNKKGFKYNKPDEKDSKRKLFPRAAAVK